MATVQECGRNSEHWILQTLRVDHTFSTCIMHINNNHCAHIRVTPLINCA